MLCAFTFMRMIMFIFSSFVVLWPFTWAAFIQLRFFTNVRHYYYYILDVSHYRQNWSYGLLLFANLYFNNFSCDPRMSFRILSQQFDTYPIYVSFASFLILNNTIDNGLRTRKMSDETKIITWNSWDYCNNVIQGWSCVKCH